MQRGDVSDAHASGNTWDGPQYDERFGFVARYGDDLLALLAVARGDRVLDLGCGTGRHAAALAQAGALVVGIDSDDSMLTQARALHPGIAFIMADARAVTLPALGQHEPFDACFSNAALHWMIPQDVVLQRVRDLLRPGASFVAEMGGAQNIARLDRALRDALEDLGLDGIPVVANYFPTIGEQSSALERAGFRVEYAAWFRRPTPLEDGTSPADWTRHFRAATWALVPAERRDELALAIDERARASGLERDGRWEADYCRLRFVAIAQ